jgi:hypothetical protein
VLLSKEQKNGNEIEILLLLKNYNIQNKYERFKKKYMIFYNLNQFATFRDSNTFQMLYHNIKF